MQTLLYIYLSLIALTVIFYIVSTKSAVTDPEDINLNEPKQIKNKKLKKQSPVVHS